MTVASTKKYSRKPDETAPSKASAKPSAKRRSTLARKTAQRTSGSAHAELRPFSVVRGKYLFWFSPEDVGFSVVCQNVFGVNAQGDTFEEALEHAVSMAEFVEKCREEDDRT